MKRRIGAGFAALALAGTFVAGTAVSAFADPLSSGQFKKQANAICAEGNQQIEAVAEQTFGKLSKGQEPTAEQLAAFATAAIPNIEQQIEGVAALEAPKSLKAKVKKLVTTARAALAKVKADPSLVTEVKHDPFAAANKQAKKLGLKDCAEDASA